VVILALGVWNIHLQDQISHDQAALTYQQAVNRAISSGGRVSTVHPTGPVPDASAALVEPPNNGHAYLIVHGLPALSSGHIYEVWLIKRSGGPVPAGVFSSDGTGAQVWHLPHSATGYSITAVTEEQGPRGSPVPRGPKVLAGAISV
jgi:hypothetical protein